jgi:hypothetical protein
VYWASGRKQFEFFAEPRSLHHELVRELGPFPFPKFWGPLAGIDSTAWIIGAARSSWNLERTGPVPVEDLKDLILARMFD